LAIIGWETVTYRTKDPFGHSGSFADKFAVVADGDPPIRLKDGSWILTAYGSRAASDLNFTLLAMVSRDGVVWEQRAIIKNNSGIGPVLPKTPGRPCFDKGCTTQACSSPAESTLNRLADGSLVVLYRNGNELSTDYAENVPLCVQFSVDEGKHRTVFCKLSHTAHTSTRSRSSRPAQTLSKSFCQFLMMYACR
jgi:hypothetical protein